MARAHAVGAAAAPAALPESVLDAAGQAARRPGARRAPSPPSSLRSSTRTGARPRRARHGAASAEFEQFGWLLEELRVLFAQELKTPVPVSVKRPHETLADCAAMNVLASLGFGLVNVFHPRMLWLMIWPMLVSLAVWVTVAFFLWSRLAVWIAEMLKQWAAPIAGWAPFDLGTAATFIATSCCWCCSFRWST